MKLSSSNNKKILIFSLKKSFSYIFSRESFCYISRNGTLHFSAQARKIKNNPPGEKFLYFRKRKPRKNFSYFLKRKLFLYFRKREPGKKFLYFRKQNFQSSKNEKKKTTFKMFFYFRKLNCSIPSLKISYFFLGEPLRVFHHCFFRCFHFTIDFTIVFGCFHC